MYQYERGKMIQLGNKQIMAKYGNGWLNPKAQLHKRYVAMYRMVHGTTITKYIFKYNLIDFRALSSK